MHTHRFGKKIKLSSTIAIKHQIRKLMWDVGRLGHVITSLRISRRLVQRESVQRDDFFPRQLVGRPSPAMRPLPR
jgi:hypothetical protein